MSRPRVLFSSWHFLFDSSNGASISALELLRGLRAVGILYDEDNFPSRDGYAE